MIRGARFDLAKKFIAKGIRADPNSLASYASNPAQTWEPQAVDMLLEYGADINMNYSYNRDNYTALGYAVLYRNFDMVMYLVDKGADVNWHAASSTSPLEVAKVGYRRYSDNCPRCPGVHYYADVPPSPEIAGFLMEHGAH